MATNYLKHLEQKYAKKKAELDAKIAQIEPLIEKGEEVSVEVKTEMNEMMLEVEALQDEITRIGKMEGFDPEQKRQQFMPTVPQILTLGDQILEDFKSGGSVRGVSRNFQAKGFLTGQGLSATPSGFKATFDSASTGLDSSRNYVTPPGGLVLIEQQRLTIRDLLSAGETTQNTIYYPKEDVYVNGAAMTGEEGEKPEATLDIGSGSAPVKKIAVLIKVTDEMWDDFPMLRDYINMRLRFMVEQEEEDQLLNGSGTGNDITGILNTSGILTQAKGADTNLDAIHKAITKVRTPAASVGGYEPDGLVINPTDWQLLRLAKDGNNQYFGGGPFTGEYGVGNYKLFPPVWGLQPVVTTAITAGTALVGAFKLGAQIFQRSGIDVKTFDQNEDDVNFNRKTIRVEERLALAVYRPSAFCTVTSIA